MARKEESARDARRSRRRPSRPRGRATAEADVSPDAGGGEVPVASGFVWNRQTEWLILAIILLVALGLRLIYFTEIRNAPDFSVPNMDAAYKDYWARSILAGGPVHSATQPDPKIGEMPYLRPPAYPFLLALVYLVTGTSYAAIRMLQIAAGLASVFLLYRIGRGLFGAAVGLIAAAMMSVYWAFIFFEGELTETPWVVLLVLLMVDQLRGWQRGVTRTRVVLPALCFALLLLSRSETLLFLPVLLGWMWSYYRALKARMPGMAEAVGAASAGAAVRSPWGMLGLFVAVLLAAIAPVTIRNYVVSREFVPICTIGGLNFYAGHNEDATGAFPDIRYDKLFGISTTLSHHNFPEILRAFRQKMGDDTLRYSDLERFFLREGLRFIASHPLQELKLLIKKTLLYWGPAEISSNKVEYLEKRASPVLRFLPSWPVAAALFFAGLALYAARMRGGGWAGAGRDPSTLLLVLILLFIAVSFATHLVFFVTARFRVPVVPFLLLFGAYAVHELFGFVRRNEAQQLLRWGAVLVFLLAVAHINFAGYRYEPDRWHFQRGASYGVVGDIERALAELHAAVAAGTTIPAVPSELGFAYAYKGDFANAEKWYREALKLDPRHADTLNKLSYTLLQLGRPQEALEVARQASEADFTASGPWLNRASALLALERPQEAEEALKQALAINPGEAEACLRLADLYIRQQRFEEAIAQLEMLVRLRPDSPEAHNYLGYEYARAGRYEEAEAAYRRAIALNVDFTLAYNNLGNLYAQQGRYDEAVVQFSEVVRVNGYDPYVHYSWAWVELQRNRLDRAQEHINYHLEINPEQVEGINLAGEIALKRGEVPKALEYFRKAIVLNVAYAPARINLAQVLENQGALAEALEQYDVVLKYDPTNAAALQASQRLRQGLGRI